MISNQSLVSRALEYYPLGASSSYTWSRGYPQSCTCKESHVEKAKCKLFQCTCACDLTAGACDYNCCCDPDCTSSQISRFKDLGDCSDEGFTEDVVQLCYTSNQLAKVNPREPSGGQTTAQDAVGNALCVYKKNYATKGEYYTDVSEKSSDIFDTSSGQKAFDYIEDPFVSSVDDTYYDYGDKVYAFSYSATTNNRVSFDGSGLLTLPRPDDGGLCSEYNPVLFAVERPVERCLSEYKTSSLEEFVAQCETRQSVDYRVNSLFVASAAAAISSLSKLSTVNVTLSSLMFEEYFTGEITADLLSSWTNNNCVTNAGNVSSYLSSSPSCLFSTADWTGKTGTVCQGMIKSVAYTVVHRNGAITNVTADVIITDVLLPRFNSESDNAVLVEQSFAVEFFSENEAGRSATNGNLVNRRKSGNPGYRQGKPVVFGVVTSGITASGTVDEVIDGLTVPSPFFDTTSGNAAAACPSYANANDSIAVPIQFGYDISSGCSMYLTRNELTALCNSFTNNKYFDSTGVPYFFSSLLPASGITHYLGYYGNADPLDRTQWLEITYSTLLSSSPVWTASTGTCSNLASTLQFEFLVTRSGERGNPQNKIVSSSISLVTSDWTSRIPVDNNVTRQAFPLTVTATFVFSEEEKLRGYSPPAPPVLFKVPYDVFYPFYVSAGHSTQSTFGKHLEITWLCVSLVMYALWIVM